MTEDNDLENFDHESHVRRAIELAREAAGRGDRPLGSVLARGDEVVTTVSARVVDPGADFPVRLPPHPTSLGPTTPLRCGFRRTLSGGVQTASPYLALAWTPPPDGTCNYVKTIRSIRQ